ncbi:MAG: nuclear transport factor 2 family protein [Acidimicrobiales bacterium]
MTAEIDRDVREDVVEVLVRYATGIDRRDWALFRTCFTDDCEADYGAIGAWHGADEITAWMERSHAPCGHTMHRITNAVVGPNGRGVAARSYVDAIVMGPDNQTGSRAVGYYDDELVRTEHGWKIAARRFTMVHLQLDLGPSASL